MEIQKYTILGDMEDLGWDFANSLNRGRILDQTEDERILSRTILLDDETVMRLYATRRSATVLLIGKPERFERVTSDLREKGYELQPEEFHGPIGY